jgi:hypothetical protein
MPHKLPDLVLLFIFILVIAIPLTSTPAELSRFWDRSGTPQPINPAMAIAKTIIDFPPAFSAYFDDHHLLHQRWWIAINFASIFCATVFPNVLISKRIGCTLPAKIISRLRMYLTFTAGELQVDPFASFGLE